MMIEYLDWDSSFFDRKIFKITVPPGFNVAELRKQVAETDADVFYLFSGEKITLPEILPGAQLLEFGGNVELEKQLEPCQAESEYEIIELSAPAEEIYELAELSGRCSRFYLDPGFAADFSRFYRHWLDKAFNSPGCSLLAAIENGKLLGLNLYSIHEAYGRIELLSVREEFRRRGVAASLLRQVENRILERNISRMCVATQLQNHNACGFYQACGYRNSTITYIWHLWKNQKK